MGKQLHNRPPKAHFTRMFLMKRRTRTLRALWLALGGSLIIFVAALIILSPGRASANSTSSKVATPAGQDAGNGTQTSQATQDAWTATPTAVSGKWEAAALSELADSLGWPTAVSEDESGKVSISLLISSTEHAQVSIRPFEYSAGAEAAFQAEQQDALLAGLQLTPYQFYTYPAYLATGSNAGVTNDRRLHWVTGERIMGVDISGSGSVMQALDPLSLGQQLIETSIEHGLPAPPGWSSTPQLTQGGPPSPSPTTVACGVSFTDVGLDYWAYSYISQLACSGVISGYSDGTFRPKDPTTRAQLTKMIVLTEGWPLANPDQPTFVDVDGSHLFYRYVETAYAHGIIHGYDGGLFKPDDYVTRAEVAKMLVLARGWDLTVGTPDVLCDVPTSHWAWTYVQVAIQQGAFTGYANGCFLPDAFATRAQLAKVIVQSQQ
jgi:S-layer homology domain